ncbi:MAG: hypothetical protein AAGK10_14690 [Cyanobacteria bacterium J06555_3]
MARSPQSPVHLAEPKALSHALHDDGADAPQTKVPAGDRWSRLAKINSHVVKS